MKRGRGRPPAPPETGLYHRITVRLPKAQDELARKVAAATGKSVSQLLREAIDHEAQRLNLA